MCLPETAANTSVRPPTRPQNIKSIKIKWDTVPTSVVIPNVRPTVPIAEAVSKRQVKIGISSMQLMIIPPERKSTTYIRRMVAASFTVLSEMRR